MFLKQIKKYLIVNINQTNIYGKKGIAMTKRLRHQSSTLMENILNGIINLEFLSLLE